MERMLKDDDVIREGDIIHTKWGRTNFASSSQGMTVEETKDRWHYIIKVTRPGKERKMEKKVRPYPKRFFVQRCNTNNDPSDLSINVNPEQLDMDYPMLEITWGKKGWKVRMVKKTAKTVITTKEVK